MPRIHSSTVDGKTGEGGGLIQFSPDLATSRFCAPNIETAYITDADAGCVRFAGTGLTIAHLVQIDGGSDNGQVVASSGGRLVLTTNDADNDAIFLGFWGPVATAVGTLPFLPVAGTVLRFGVKMKILDVDKSDVMFGLANVDTEPFGGVTDGVYLEKIGAAVVFSSVLEQDSTETTTALTTTIVDNTYFEAGFIVTGLDTVHNFVDDEVVAASAVTNLDDDEPLCPFIAIRNFGAQVNTLTIERISCTQSIA